MSYGSHRESPKVRNSELLLFLTSFFRVIAGGTASMLNGEVLGF